MLTAKYMVWTKLKTWGIAIFGNSESLWKFVAACYWTYLI
jgi:hypothetical protein